MLNFLGLITFGLIGHKVKEGQKWILASHSSLDPEAVIFKVLRVAGNDVEGVWYNQNPNAKIYRTQNKIRSLYFLMKDED